MPTTIIAILTVIGTALVAGIVAGSRDVAAQAVKDGYNALKRWIIRGPGSKTGMQQVEKKPDPDAPQMVAAAGIDDKDFEIIEQAQALLRSLKECGQLPAGTTYNATLNGNGAVARGAGAAAAGAGGIAISGNVQEATIITGDRM